MDDSANAADDERAVSRKPFTRQLRSRGAALAPRGSSHLIASKSFEAFDSSEPEMNEPLPTLRRARSFTPEDSFESPRGLGEVHNRSTRRNKHLTDYSKSVGLEASHDVENVGPVLDHLPAPPVSPPDPRSVPRQTTRRHRLFGSRTSTARRSQGGDQSRHIESLEAQVASLQTQLQSSSSPSLQRSNSSKLRALNSEAKLLRQEISEWEMTFNGRVRDQLEQYELVAGSLRARIRYLEKERDNKDHTIEGLENDLSSKTEAIEAIESAHRELERRLESMTNLVGKATPRLELVTTFPEAHTPGRMTRTTTEPLTPASSRYHDGEMKVTSPLQKRHLRQRSEISMISENPFDSGTESAKDSGYVTELASEASDGVFRDSATRTTRPISWAPTATTDMLSRSRPSQRRMRRFYAGNTAQSLILPAARSAGDAPLSAPLSAPTTAMQSPSIPPMSSPIRDRFPVHSPSSSRGSISIDLRQRSATMDGFADPVKRHRPADLKVEVTPRPPILRHGRTATDGSIATHNRSQGLGGFHFIRSDEESQSSDTMRMGNSTPSSDCLSSEVSALPAPSPPLHSPLRCAFGPELNVEAAIGTPRQQSRTPARGSATSPCGGNPRHPMSRVGGMIEYVHHSFEAHIYAARYMFATTWQDLAVARPVLEFRCWLVRVLLGRLRDKGTLFLVRRSSGRASLTNPAGVGLRTGVGSPVAFAARKGLPPGALVDDELFLDVIDDGDVIMPPVAPPIHWLRFSMTLICAVGVAIKDGPATLFTRPAPSDVQMTPSHRREPSLLGLLMPGVGGHI